MEEREIHLPDIEYSGKFFFVAENPCIGIY